MNVAFTQNGLNELEMRVHVLQEENRSLREAQREATRILGELEARQADLLRQNKGLSTANATSAELVAEIEMKNQVMEETNQRLALSNVHAAELVAELELRNQQIGALNVALSRANADSGEMISEIESKNEALNEANQRLALANAEAAELMAEIEIKNQNIEKLNQTLRKRNKEIALLSVSDPLTGVFNRNHLNKQLPLEIRRSRRYKHPVSMILCDLDHFKAINDQYGHQAGDRVLQEFTDRIQSVLREGVDWMVRYGGEEFVIVLPETTLRGAITCAERCREKMSEKCFSADHLSIGVTASFGVADLVGRESDSPQAAADSLIGRADRNLYGAKEAGRNCVIGER